jgi:hypothetical protein
MIEKEDIFILGDNVELLRDRKSVNSKRKITYLETEEPIPEFDNMHDKMDWVEKNRVKIPFFDCVENTLDWIETHNIINPVIYVGVYYSKQLNWEMDKETVKRMANCNATFCFSGYNLDTENEV